MADALGPRHTSVAWTLNDIADLLARQGKLDEAMAMYHDVLSIRREGFGPSHVHVATTLNNM